MAAVRALRLPRVVLLPVTAPRRLAPRSMTTTAASASSSAIKEAYDELAAGLREQSSLEGVMGIIGWDELTFMPPGAADVRAAQKSALAGVLHDTATTPRRGELLAALADVCDLAAAGLAPGQVATVREATRAYHKKAAVPRELAQRRAALESSAYSAWVAARGADEGRGRWSDFAPSLRAWIDIIREQAALTHPGIPDVYDAALDDYEKGATAARMDALFAELKRGLIPILDEIKARRAARDAAAGGPVDDGAPLRVAIDVGAQARLCRAVAIDLGFDLEAGRLDVSVHPFTGGCAGDCRMTTRYKPNDFTEGLTGTVHETGHSLYEQGRNPDALWSGLPVADPLSMGIHESQSLIWERSVALSRPFAVYLSNKLSSFGDQPGDGAEPGDREALRPLAALSAEDIYRGMNEVRRESFVRVEADEVQYSLHVILRYEIERDLLAGNLDAADVPAVWNRKMEEALGVVVPNDAAGCLQDVHWSAGAVGYFPTYVVGAVAAAQLHEAAAAALPSLDADVAAGNFGPLRTWLREAVHHRGRPCERARRPPRLSAPLSGRRK